MTLRINQAWAHRVVALTLGMALGCQPTSSNDEGTQEDDSADDDSGLDEMRPDGTCWSVAPDLGQLVVVELDPDSGTWSEVGRYGDWINFSFHTRGLARLGESLVMAGYDGSGGAWMRVDLGMDTTSWGNGTHVESVTSDGEVLIAYCDHGSICRYPNFDALDAGAPTDVLVEGHLIDRLAATPAELFVQLADAVDVHDVSDGTMLRSLTLDGLEDRGEGVAVLGDTLFVLLPVFQEGDLLLSGFDTATGAPEGATTFSGFDYAHLPSGLWCE